jgi:hypothetical protein
MNEHDRMPTAAELREAAGVLGVPLTDNQAIRPDDSARREVTRLLALLDSWLTAYGSFNARFVDERSAEEAFDIALRAEYAANGGVPTSLMSGALWRIGAAIMAVSSLGPVRRRR